MENQSSLDTNTTLPGNEIFMRYCMVYDFAVEGILMGILCIFGFCGNALSMVCLSKDKSKTATPFLLVSLEAADTLFLITVLILRVINSICMYYDTYYTHSIWAYVGKFVYPFALITETGTIYVTLLVTLNRYVAVCKPYDASRMCSIPHARQHVLLVLAFAILYNIPRFLEYDIEPDPAMQRHNETILRPYPSKLQQDPAYQIIYANIIYFLVLFLVPLVLLIFLNSKLITALRETKRRRAQLIGDSHSRSEEDITLILIVVVLVFVVCQTPALFTQVLGNVLSEESKACGSVFFYFERISDLLVVGNSSLNFIIYCFCSKKFREILKSLLCKQRDNSVLPRRVAVGNVVQQRVNGQYTPVPTNTNNMMAENGNCADGMDRGTEMHTLETKDTKE